MKISIVAAFDLKNGLGINGKIPWRLSADMKRFKSLTMGHHIVMGRKTCESIGNPLSGRVNIVISRNKTLKLTGFIIVGSLQEAVVYAENAGESEFFVIGGGEIYKLALPIASTMYLTRVKAELPADTFFPNYDESEWCEESTRVVMADDQNQYESSFHIYRRKIWK